MNLPQREQIERLIRSSLHKQETQFCASALSKLPPQAFSKIDALLSLEEEANNAIDIEESKKLRQFDFHYLKTDPGPVGLDSFLTEVDKLKRIRRVGLPANLFERISPKVLLSLQTTSRY